MKWVRRRDKAPDDGNEHYYTLNTPLGIITVMYFRLQDGEHGWQASINPAGTDDDPLIGPMRATPQAARNDAERWLRGTHRRLNRYMEAK